jgi:hypothetical protein
MTIIVSVKINDGVVMASDSAATFGNGQIYHHADKIVNLVKGLPIGAMVTGNGGIGNESVSTLLKDLRRRLSDRAQTDWYLEAATYTMEQVAARVRRFLFEEKARQLEQDVWMQLRICGYSAGRPLAEIWEVLLAGQNCDAPKRVQHEHESGVLWDGEYQALDRLILGRAPEFPKFLTERGVQQDQVVDMDKAFCRRAYGTLALSAMPTQDAIDLARFLVETTIGFVRFHLTVQPKTVGGPVEIAAITKHEGFRWVQRKHFYPAELNPPLSP